MEDKLLTPSEEAKFFGVSADAISARKRNLSSYPAQIADPVRLCPVRRESELIAYSIAYHDFVRVRERSLFSRARLLEMTEAEAIRWGAHSDWIRKQTGK